MSSRLETLKLSGKWQTAHRLGTTHTVTDSAATLARWMTRGLPTLSFCSTLLSHNGELLAWTKQEGSPNMCSVRQQETSTTRDLQLLQVCVCFGQSQTICFDTWFLCNSCSIVWQIKGVMCKEPGSATQLVMMLFKASEWMMPFKACDGTQSENLRMQRIRKHDLVPWPLVFHC